MGDKRVAGAERRIMVPPGRTHQVRKCLRPKGLQKQTWRVAYAASPCASTTYGILMRTPWVPLLSDDQELSARRLGRLERRELR